MSPRVARLLSRLARVPLVKRTLARPRVRRALDRLPASRLLYTHGWDRLHPFDRRNGTDTSGTVPIEALSSDPSLTAHGIFYAGSQPSVVRSALATLPPLDGFTFVDLGCGKGRVLLVANEFPFARLVGVDVSAELVATARRNAAHVGTPGSGGRPIEVIVGDASAFSLPPGNLVIYLYHPFDAELMRGVVRTIETALTAAPRQLFVVYCNPVAGATFDESRYLTRRFADSIPYSAEDLGYGPDAADPVLIWQGGQVPPPAHVPDDVEITVRPPRRRALLVRPSQPHREAS